MSNTRKNARNRKPSLLSIETCEAYVRVKTVVDWIKSGCIQDSDELLLAHWIFKKQRKWLKPSANLIGYPVIIIKWNYWCYYSEILLHCLHCYLWRMLCFMQMYPLFWYTPVIFLLKQLPVSWYYDLILFKTYLTILFEVSSG